MNPNQPVVFYDDKCGLCQSFVRWLMARDGNQILKFEPLGGENALRVLGEKPPDAVHLAVHGKVYNRSDAALRTLMLLGGFYKLAGVFFIVPRLLRNDIYDFVAKHRNRARCSREQ